MRENGKNYVRPRKRIEIAIQMPEEELKVIVVVLKQMKEAVERLHERVYALEGKAIEPKPQEPQLFGGVAD